MALLIIRRPGWPEEHVTINGPTLIGRDAEVSVRLNDPAVSTRHCKIEPIEEFWSITDLKSRTGTFIDDVRVTTRYLRDVETIRIAGFEVEFHSQEEQDEVLFADLGEPPVTTEASAPTASVVASAVALRPTVTKVVAAQTDEELAYSRARRIKVIFSAVALLAGGYLIYSAVSGESTAPNPAVVKANWVQPAGD